MSLWLAAATAVAALFAVIGAFVQGKRSGRQQVENKALKDQMLTREEIDNATIDGDLSLADRVLAERLRWGKDRK